MRKNEFGSHFNLSVVMNWSEIVALFCFDYFASVELKWLELSIVFQLAGISYEEMKLLF